MLRPFVCAFLLTITPALAQTQNLSAQKDIAVDVVNRSEPELCAEKDNVWLDFKSREVKSFQVQAILLSSVVSSSTNGHRISQAATCRVIRSSPPMQGA
jgi:hypothetical protein